MGDAGIAGDSETRAGAAQDASGGFWVGSGTPALESLLCREVEVELAAARRHPARLASPLRVVVPSSSLRIHVSALLVRRLGPSLLGLRVQTLGALAREILNTAGELPAPEALFPVIARQVARRERALSEALDPLVDGYGAVVAAIDDLLDAGLTPEHAEALDEQLEESGAGARARRARAIVRSAAEVARRLGSGEVGHRSQMFARAAERLEADPGILPTRRLWLHGFADATGTQSDLIEGLLRRRGAWLLLDESPHPAGEGNARAGASFGERFRERVTSAAPARSAAADESPAPQLEVLHAPTPEAEARAVAVRLRALLDAGAAPERIGVVARDVGERRLALRRQLRRLAIPFSGIAERGSVSPAGRKLEALLRVLGLGERTSVEAFLDALARVAPEPGARLRRLGNTRRADLRHALHGRGVATLADVATFSPAPGEGFVSLPVARGLRASDEGGPNRERRRQLAASVFGPLAAMAAAARDRLERWPERASVDAHRRRLRTLVRADLGWTSATPGWRDLDEAIFSEPALMSELEIDRDDWAVLVRRQQRDRGRDALGGEGGGVQVLSVMEARARSFDHLFLMGLSRGSFPRIVSEDPLLPDSLRAGMRTVLPDLPVKRDGHDEERFLFAQLLTSSPHAVLSCSLADDDGRARPTSPLLEQLCREPGVPAPVVVGADAAGPRPASEHARVAGLLGTRADFESVLPLALADARAALGLEGAVPSGLAPARLATLRELDTRSGAPATLGPFFGLIGAPHDPVDPRATPPSVTAVERVARCPWLGFVDRVLRVRAVRDPRDALPSAADKRLLGNVVHGALERIVLGALSDPPKTLEEARGRVPTPVAWPAPAELERLLGEAAAEVVADESIAVPGYARVLARRAAPALEVARRLDWHSGSVDVVGAEVEGAVHLPGRGDGPGREIRFRADRVDLDADGALRITDYKTGTPAAKQTGAARRTEAHLAGVREGRLLQATAYALAGGKDAEGRYLYLGDVPDERVRELATRAEPAFAEGFRAATDTLLEAWDRGAFAPRLRRADRDEEPGTCRYCEVKEACHRGDSGARLRIGRWAEQAQPGALGPAERACLALWRLGTDET